MNKLTKIIFVVGALAVGSCQTATDQADGHSHQSETDGHSHQSEVESHTIWTEQTELFVEFPALVAGQISRFAAHCTVLKDHQAVNAGSLTISLIQNNQGIRSTADAPSSPGIFTSSLQPQQAGSYQLVFDLITPSYTDKVVLEGIQVYENSEAARVALGASQEDQSISFLKEQAWKIEFQTAPVVLKQIYQVIPTAGTWKVSPSDYQTLVASAEGRVQFNSGVLTEGSPVKKGQVLMTISSAGLTNNNLQAEIQKARINYQQAQSEFQRKKQLYDAKIVPKAEFEQVEQKYLVAKTTYESMSSGYSAGGKRVLAPMDGYIKSLQAVNGGFVEQGKALVTITSHKSSLLEVQVSSKYSTQLTSIQNLWYQPQPGVWSNLNEKGGRILSVAKDVASDQPMIAVFAEINEAVSMPEGSFTEAQLMVGEANNSLVVPASSVLEDYGSYSVMVQLSGESFERRNVTIGKRNGGEIEIVRGLQAGEVVVSKGAYQVKMAALSDQAPAHGHAH